MKSATKKNKKPIKRFINKEEETKRHWEMVGVTLDQVLDHPRISHILTKTLGSIPDVIEYLRGSDAKEAMDVVRLWDLGSGRQHEVVPFEGYCLAAGTTPKRMMGVIMECVTEQADTAATLLVRSRYQEVAEKTVNMALTADGVMDRKMIHQNRGFLPAPKNQTIHNFGQLNQANGAQQIANVQVSQLEQRRDAISKAVDRFNESRVTKQIEDAEIVEEEE